MFKCIECGHIFEYGEEEIIINYSGECHGSPAVERWAVCPICGSGFENYNPWEEEEEEEEEENEEE